jgi:hypothetical protein
MEGENYKNISKWAGERRIIVGRVSEKEKFWNRRKKFSKQEGGEI